MGRINIKKALLPLAVVTILLVIIFSPLNYLLSEKISQEKGTYIQQRAYFVSDDLGTRGGIELVFELDSGRTVSLKKKVLTKAVEPGDRVMIYFRKGVWFGNKMYERYEPLKDPQRYWTKEELVTVKN